jgi:outer membrane receptor protein involved in Fe transport
MKIKFIYLIILINIEIFANETNLSKIIVTPTSTEQSIFEAPISIVHFSKELVEDTNVINAADILNKTSGVFISTYEPTIGFYTAIRRGLSYGPYYLYLQDGIALQSSVHYETSIFWNSTYNHANDGIELIKGPGTVLYGSSAISAVINTLSQKTNKSLTHEINTQIGSYGYGNLSYKQSDTLKNGNSYLLSSSYTHSDGWQNSTDLFYKYDFFGKYIDISDNNTIITHTINSSTFKGNEVSTYTLSDFKSNPKYSGHTANKPYIQSEFIQYNAAIFKEYDNIDSETTPYIRHVNNKYVKVWVDGYPHTNTTINTIGLKNITNYYDKNKIYSFGIDFEYTKYSRYVDTLDSSILMYDYDVNFYNISPFYNYKIKQGNIITNIGLRYDYSKYNYKNNIASGSSSYLLNNNQEDIYRPENRSDKFDEFNPSISSAYILNNTNSIYFRYAHAFRIPEAKLLYERKQQPIYGDIKPESTNSFEIGYKGIDFNIVSYYQMIKDTILYREDGSQEIFYNGENSISRGIEIDKTFKFTNKLTTNISYAYNEHKFNTTNKYVAQSPKHIGNIEINYILNEKLKTSFEYQYIGEYFRNDKNTLNDDGYSLGNLTFIYNKKTNLKYNLKITNITNKKYIKSAEEWGVRPGSPRMFIINMKYSY